MRSPLKDTSNLVHRRPAKPVYNHQHQPQQQQSHQSHHHTVADSEDERNLRNWQRQWRRIMSTAKLYFDWVDTASIDKVRPTLDDLGTEIDPFFSTEITHVVSKRVVAGKSYPPSDVLTRASQEGMKVWSYSKLLRFLAYLTGTTIADADANPIGSVEQGQLSTMLQQEKYMGPNDRDPTARREDYYYFKAPYVLVWDPTHQHRPILYKEYSKNAPWPHLQIMPPGFSPFITEEEAKEIKVKLRDEVGNDNAKPLTETSTQEGNSIEADVKAAEKTIKDHQKAAYEDAESHQSNHNHGISFNPQPRHQKYYDLAASGINKSTSTSATRSNVYSTGDRSGNGLAPPGAHPSREFNLLKKKALLKRDLPPIDEQRNNHNSLRPSKVAKVEHQPEEPEKKERKRMGYCENCQVQFEKFDDHANSTKHLKYASDPQNFVKLDKWIAYLQRK